MREVILAQPAQRVGCPQSSLRWWAVKFEVDIYVDLYGYWSTILHSGPELPGLHSFNSFFVEAISNLLHHFHPIDGTLFVYSDFEARTSVVSLATGLSCRGRCGRLRRFQGLRRLYGRTRLQIMLPVGWLIRRRRTRRSPHRFLRVHQWRRSNGIDGHENRRGDAQRSNCPQKDTAFYCDPFSIWQQLITCFVRHCSLVL